MNIVIQRVKKRRNLRSRILLVVRQPLQPTASSRKKTSSPRRLRRSQPPAIGRESPTKRILPRERIPTLTRIISPRGCNSSPVEKRVPEAGGPLWSLPEERREEKCRGETVAEKATGVLALEEGLLHQTGLRLSAGGSPARSRQHRKRRRKKQGLQATRERSRVQGLERQ